MRYQWSLLDENRVDECFLIYHIVVRRHTWMNVGLRTLTVLVAIYILCHSFPLQALSRPLQTFAKARGMHIYYLSSKY